MANNAFLAHGCFPRKPAILVHFRSDTITFDVDHPKNHARYALKVEITGFQTVYSIQPTDGYPWRSVRSKVGTEEPLTPPLANFNLP